MRAKAKALEQAALDSLMPNSKRELTTTKMETVEPKKKRLIFFVDFLLKLN